MQKTLLTSWPLFFGLSMIMIGAGLQSTLLGVRATMDGFPTYATGLIMSMYYLGFLFGSHYVPLLIRGVGHIRVFAALASIASMTVLLHALFPTPTPWALVRGVTGFCYAGLYIVMESWLNQATGNDNRGKIMAAYLVIMYASMAAGQYLLNLADPKGMELFVIASLLVTMAVMPISLSSRPAPHFEKPVKVSPFQLFKTSPLGVFGVFCSGMANACLFSIGPVYAAQEGFTLPQISTFMAAAIFGGVLLQFPIGSLSDKYDRRSVLIGVSALASLFSASAILLATFSIYALFLAMALIGGTALTIYGLASSHTNDHLAPAQIVAASASMIMVNGIGSILGPILSTSLMNAVAPWMLFSTMSAVYGSITVYGLYRSTRRPPVPLNQQSHFVAQPSPSSIMVMQQATEQAAESIKSLENSVN